MISVSGLRSCCPDDHVLAGLCGAGLERDVPPPGGGGVRDLRTEEKRVARMRGMRRGEISIFRQMCFVAFYANAAQNCDDAKKCPEREKGFGLQESICCI